MLLIVNIDTLLYYLNEKFGSLYFIILYELVNLSMFKVQD